ncbi:hypothetical protein [Rhodopirellula bahusiensis]|uniref:hypothetical protein n=1 Tax=Rhodopirellula bahusiensis TaxID=2014065 RepID=UPI00326430C2
MTFLHRRQRLLRSLVASAAVSFPVACTPVAMAQTGDFDPEDRGSKVEDDAWYDVSEWFDGNDYNPTDEAIGRWDDEVFSYEDAHTSGDSDNDQLIIPADTFYGEDYNESYVSYEDRDEDGTYERSTRYIDSDGDHLSDAYVTYDDKDGDGMYENYDYSELGSTSKNAVPPSKIAQSVKDGLSGKRHEVTGTIRDRKTVQRGNEYSLMMQVKSQDGKDVWIDLGGHATGLQIFKDDKATFFGPMVKRGEKEVLVVTAVDLPKHGMYKVERSGSQYSGVVESTKAATVRGEKHRVVKLKTKNGKMLTVDMGLESDEKNISEGDEVSVTGVPVKIGDRVILIADKT